MCKVLILLFLSVITVMNAQTQIPEALDIRTMSETDAMVYLSKYGYMDPFPNQSVATLDPKSVRTSIKKFQRFFDLNMTGQLDNATLNMMGMPRCGMKDVHIGDRIRRYALRGGRWTKKALTYKISQYPQQISQSEADKEIQKAFDEWSKVIDLKFSVQTGDVDIDITFVSGRHGDGDPFDGRGGILAHAYFPAYGGDAHFDGSERWTINENFGTNLFQVALHEFGHSLGLEHSNVETAIMYPTYRGYQANFTIDDDDVAGITMLYGRRLMKETPDTPPDGAQGATDICNNAKIDTIFTDRELNTYIFQGDHYWQLTRRTLLPGFPKKIATKWKGLPNNIDAAFTYWTKRTYFFKGTQFWRFKGNKMMDGYPKEISEGFPGIPNQVDAVIEWNGNGKIYFFKGNQSYEYDRRMKINPTRNFPLSLWKNVPNDLDAAMSWNGYTVFFKDQGFYVYDDSLLAVSTAGITYPLSIAYWFFKCPKATNGTLGRYVLNARKINTPKQTTIVAADSYGTCICRIHSFAVFIFCIVFYYLV